MQLACILYMELCCIIDIKFEHVEFCRKLCYDLAIVKLTIMKFVNFRPMVFFVISLILGIVVSTYYFAGKISNVLFIILLCLFALILVVDIIFIVLKRKVFTIKRIFKRILFCLIAFVIGMCSIVLTNVNITKAQVKSDTYNITARVESVQVFYDNQDLSKVILDEIVIHIDETDLLLNSKMKLYSNGDLINDKLVIGNVIKFSGRVNSLSLNNDSEISKKFNNLANEIYYSCNLKSDIEILDEYRVTVFEDIKLKAKDIMDSRFDEDISAIGYGMLFGEDSYIDSEIVETYNDAGISHLLAVSGLHVGFVILLLSMILSLFKINEKTSSIILISILFLYVIICGFSTSVVRAFIMTTCMLLCKLFDRRYDSLNSLALAGSIILVFSPLDLFTAGFQLSFMAVLGIILLNPLFSRFFSKFLFEQFADSLSLSLSASFGIMPIMAINFHKISALSVFTNMIVVPVASLGFMLLFLGVILGMIIPVLSYIIVPFDFIMRFVTAIADVVANISINMFEVNTGSALIFFCLGIYAVLSEYVRLKTWIKIVIVSILVLFYILILVL